MKIAKPILDAASTQYEMIANPQLDAVPTHTGTMAHPTMGRPITKELKNIKIKTIVEMNLDEAQFIINYLRYETEKQFKPQFATVLKLLNAYTKISPLR